MGTATVRPDVLYAADAGWTVTGGGGVIPTALSDNSDASYISSGSTVGPVVSNDMGTVAPPALAQYRSVTLRVRANAASGPWVADAVAVEAGGVRGTYDQIAWNTTITTFTGAARTTAPNGAAWSQFYVDSMRVVVKKSLNLITQTVYEVYADVTYNEAPVATPAAPVGTVTTTSQPTVTWAYSDPEADPQERYKIRVFSAAQYGAGGFNAATSPATWESGEVFSAATSATVTAPLPNNTTYRAYVSVADVGSGGRYGAYSYGTAQFTIQIEPPAVPDLAAAADNTLARVSLALASHNNILSANQSSLETDIIGWAATTNVTIAVSATQAAHGVNSLRLSSVAAGTMTAQTSGATNGFPVLPGVSYVARASFHKGVATARQVRIDISWYTAAGALVSTSTGTSSLEGAAWTEVTVTATAPPTAALGSVVANVVATGGALELHYVDKIGIAPAPSAAWSIGGFIWNVGLVGTGVFVVERSVDAGTTWAYVRGADQTSTAPIPTSQTATFYDYELPRGVPALYRARIQGTTGGNAVSSASSANQAATLASTGWWLKDPLAPGLNMQLDVARLGYRRKKPQQVYEPLGAASSLVVHDGVRGIAGAVEVYSKSKARHDKLEAILATGRTLFLEDVLGRVWYVQVGDAMDWSLVVAAPDVGETTPIRHFHTISLPVTEVASPTGQVVAAGTPTP